MIIHYSKKLEEQTFGIRFLRLVRIQGMVFGCYQVKLNQAGYDTCFTWQMCSSNFLE